MCPVFCHCKWQSPWPRGRGLPLAVDKERGGRKPRARLPPFSADSWGYSAFQYILASQALQKKRCAAASQGSRFSTASALRASAGRRKTPRSRGWRLFSTLVRCQWTCGLGSRSAHRQSAVGQKAGIGISGPAFCPRLSAFVTWNGGPNSNIRSCVVEGRNPEY